MNGAEERVRVLEFQVDALRRELTLVSRRYEDIVYSAAWTIARPLKRLEEGLHRRAKSFAGRKGGGAAAAMEAAADGPDGEEAIAARIACKMAQTSVRG